MANWCSHPLQTSANVRYVEAEWAAIIDRPHERQFCTGKVWSLKLILFAVGVKPNLKRSTGDEVPAR